MREEALTAATAAAAATCGGGSTSDGPPGSTGAAERGTGSEVRVGAHHAWEENGAHCDEVSEGCGRIAPRAYVEVGCGLGVGTTCNRRRG